MIGLAHPEVVGAGNFIIGLFAIGILCGGTAVVPVHEHGVVPRLVARPEVLSYLWDGKLQNQRLIISATTIIVAAEPGIHAVQRRERPASPMSPMSLPRQRRQRSHHLVHAFVMWLSQLGYLLKFKICRYLSLHL